jgi:hypothetical protein
MLLIVGGKNSRMNRLFDQAGWGTDFWRFGRGRHDLGIGTTGSAFYRILYLDPIIF